MPKSSKAARLSSESEMETAGGVKVEEEVVTCNGSRRFSQVSDTGQPVASTSAEEQGEENASLLKYLCFKSLNIA